MEAVTAMMKRKNATDPCVACGSTSPRKMVAGTSFCANGRTCRERRCRRRQREDDIRAAKEGMREQCRATTGQRSISFCLLRTGHGGLHLNGVVEWADREEHPVAATFRDKPVQSASNRTSEDLR